MNPMPTTSTPTHSNPAPFLPSERKLVDAAMELLCAEDPSAYAILLQGEGRLMRLSLLLRDYPSLRSQEDLGPYHRDTDTLIDTLCCLDPLELKLRMPSKAVLVESYMLTKAQHLKGLLLAMLGLPSSETRNTLRSALFLEISNIIHTYLLYQLLLDVILDEDLDREIKRHSARYLITLWDTCAAQQELSGFFHIIRSLWDARLHIRVRYGTLLGTDELLQLIEAECDPMILDHFTDRDLSEEEAIAFQEFLFGLTYEELLRLRNEMKAQGIHVISSKEVTQMLNIPKTERNQHLGLEQDPHEVYRSYKRRRFQARYRIKNNLEGPRRTAEEYLVLWILRDHDERSSSSESSLLPRSST
ncbi:MAG: hypothetical protein H6728_02490 [Myxococcales bacterium]|nr:hypothetical protein [Myxococcales bacterium]MCB9641923.1 hypothetical protein [Myxococcales bacterium]